MNFDILTGLFSFSGKVRVHLGGCRFTCRIVEYHTTTPILDALPPYYELTDKKVSIFLEEMSLGLKEQYNPDFLKTTWED